MIKSRKVWKCHNSIFSMIEVARFFKLRIFGLFKDMDRRPNVSMLILLEFQDLVSYSPPTPHTLFFFLSLHLKERKYFLGSVLSIWGGGWTYSVTAVEGGIS